MELTTQVVIANNLDGIKMGLDKFLEEEKAISSY